MTLFRRILLVCSMVYPRVKLLDAGAHVALTMNDAMKEKRPLASIPSGLRKS